MRLRASHNPRKWTIHHATAFLVIAASILGCTPNDEPATPKAIDKTVTQEEVEPYILSDPYIEITLRSPLREMTLCRIATLPGHRPSLVAFRLPHDPKQPLVEPGHSYELDMMRVVGLHDYPSAQRLLVSGVNSSDVPVLEILAVDSATARVVAHERTLTLPQVSHIDDIEWFHGVGPLRLFLLDRDPSADAVKVWSLTDTDRDGLVEAHPHLWADSEMVPPLIDTHSLFCTLDGDVQALFSSPDDDSVLMGERYIVMSGSNAMEDWHMEKY